MSTQEEKVHLEGIRKILRELEDPTTSLPRKWELSGYLEFIGRKMLEEYGKGVFPVTYRFGRRE